ncbi:MAG TPA: hypothetical protein VFL95_05900 [Gemmatimonadales bacterium]|nr:hypothetical protein [Gemmatimonadales bacterium]
MNRLWIKIALGAVVVFVIGMAGVTLVRRGTSAVKQTVAGFTALGVIPHELGALQVDGVPVGTVNELRIAPPKGQPDLRYMRVNLVMNDSALDQLAQCKALSGSLDSLFQNDRESDLHCLSDGSEPGYAQFGELVSASDSVRRPLFAPAAQVEKLTRKASERGAQEIVIRADSQTGGAHISVTGIDGRKLVEIDADSSHGARIMIRDQNGKPVFQLNADSAGVSIHKG